MVGLGFSYNNHRISKGALFHAFLSLLLILQLLTSVFLLAPAKPASAATPWYNPSWSFRKTVTFTASAVKIPSSQTDFPVLISITDASLQANAQADGDDILFTSANGTTKLAHEIEKYNPATGELQAWVKVPTLATSGVIYMYFGYAVAINQQNVSGVWDANYKVVQHLSETSGIHFDSTSNNNDGTPFGGVAQGTAAGKIGGADDFDGTTGYISIGNTGVTGDWTTEFWANLDTVAPVIQYPIGYSSTAKGVFLGYNAIGDRWGLFDSVATLDGTSVITTGVWNNFMVTKTGTSYSIYKNGAIEATGIRTDIDIDNLNIGKRGDNTWYGDGKIDEVRISAAARNSDWATTSYNNQNDPPTFYALGSLEESLLPTPSTGFNSTVLISLAFVSLIMGMMMIFRTRRAFFTE